MLSLIKKLKELKALALAVLTLTPVIAYAASSSQVFTPLDGNIFITDDSRGKFTCARVDETQPWLLGTLDKKTGEFKSNLKIISEKKKAAKKEKDSRKKAKKLKEIEKRREIQKKGSPICLAGPGGSLPQATPTPGGSNPPPAPTPTPTKPASNTCFNGDISKPGCFGLPPGTSGNKRTGATYFETYCDGCHNTKANINYPALVDAFNKPEMIGFKPSNQQDIYDLVAWLNRFTL